MKTFATYKKKSDTENFNIQNHNILYDTLMVLSVHCFGPDAHFISVTTGQIAMTITWSTGN